MNQKYGGLLRLGVCLEFIGHGAFGVNTRGWMASLFCRMGYSRKYSLATYADSWHDGY